MDGRAKPAPNIESAIAEMQKVINSAKTTKEAETAISAPSVSMEFASENNVRVQIPLDINAITDNIVYTTEPV